MRNTWPELVVAQLPPGALVVHGANAGADDSDEWDVVKPGPIPETTEDISRRLGFDLSRFAEPTEGGEGSSATDRVPECWWCPSTAIPGTRQIPEHWLNWFLTTREPPPAVPWATWYEWTRQRRVDPGFILYYSSARACWGESEKRSPGMMEYTCPSGNKGKFQIQWVLIPQPPLYGAYQLEGFPPQQPVKRTRNVLKVPDLRWVRWPEGEEGQGSERVRQRADLQGVWPNVVVFDQVRNRLVAIPYTSMVGVGDDPSILAGVPPYPTHITAQGLATPPVCDLRWLVSAQMIEPLNSGSVWVFEVEGSPDNRSFATKLDQEDTMVSREHVLRRMLKLSTNVSLVVLQRRKPTAGKPGQYVVMACEYPDFIRFAEPAAPATVLNRVRRMLRVVLLRGTPAITQADIDREQPDAERQLKLAVTAALVETYNAASKTRRESWVGISRPGGDQQQALALIVNSGPQALDLVRVLTVGWQPAGMTDVATLARESEGPFDEALLQLAQLREGRELSPDEAPERVAYYRGLLVNWLRDGLTPEVFKAAWNIGRDTDPDATFGQWMLLVAIGLLARWLPIPEVR